MLFPNTTTGKIPLSSLLLKSGHNGVAGSSVRTVETLQHTSFSTLESIPEDVCVDYEKRKVRWADQTENGKLAKMHFYEAYPDPQMRILVLLVHPNEQNCYELLHLEFDEGKHLTAEDFLCQICHFSKDIYFRTQTYTTLLKRGKPMRQRASLQSYGTKDRDLFVAVSANFDWQLARLQAKLLLTDKELRRTLRQLRLSGGRLQNLTSSPEWRDELAESSVLPDFSDVALDASVGTA